MSGKRALSSLRANWGELLAFAWIYSQTSNSALPNILKDLRKDPKTTIIELAKGKQGKYQEILDDETINKVDVVRAANMISEQTDTNPSEAYSGYVPIPASPFRKELLEQLNENEMAELLRLGIEGVLKFDKKAELWAKVLLKVWKDDDDESMLIKIRQDPLTALKAILGQEFEDLENSDYGILPLPNRPKGLDKLTEGKLLEGLADFLGDDTNMDHIGGIFLTAT